MNITKEAIYFFHRMFFSCYMPGKASSEHNRRILEQHLLKQQSMNFYEFCADLQEWELRKSAIISVAEEIGKKEIDREVLSRYFGGPRHTEVILEDLKKEGKLDSGMFREYVIVNHMLMPLRIKKIAESQAVISGAYENDGIALDVRGILFFEKDRKDIIVGKTILCHYPMVIDANPDACAEKALLSLQSRDNDFLNAVKSFPEGINHAKYPYLTMLRRRIANNGGL